MEDSDTKRPELEFINKNQNVIVRKFQCTENDNEIKLIHVDGDIRQAEFHIGNVDAGSHYVVGIHDMMKCLKQWYLIKGSCV